MISWLYFNNTNLYILLAILCRFMCKRSSFFHQMFLLIAAFCSVWNFFVPVHWRLFLGHDNFLYLFLFSLLQFYLEKRGVGSVCPRLLMIIFLIFSKSSLSFRTSSLSRERPNISSIFAARPAFRKLQLCWWLVLSASMLQHQI